MSLIGTLTVIGNVAGAAVAPLMGGVALTGSGGLLAAGTGATGALAGTAGTGLGATLGAAGIGTGAGGALAAPGAAAAAGAGSGGGSGLGAAVGSVGQAAAPGAAGTPAAAGGAAPGAASIVGGTGTGAAPTSSGILGTGLTTGNATADTIASTTIPSATISGGQQVVQAGLDANAQGKANNLYRSNTTNQQADLNKAGAMAGDLYGPQSGSGGWASPQPGMFAAKKGGEIALETGQFVIPADIVSALGNGDTEAGQRFLTEFFNDYA